MHMMERKSLRCSLSFADFHSFMMLSASNSFFLSGRRRDISARLFSRLEQTCEEE